MVEPKADVPDDKVDEGLLKELLKAAQDTSHLDSLSLQQKVDKILEIRLKNEMMISALLNVGVRYDQIAVEEAAAINSKAKDSIAELIKVKQLLEGLPTGKIQLEDISEINEIRRRIFN